MARYSAARRYGGGDPAIKIKIEKTGDWYRIHNILDQLPNTLQAAVLSGQRSVAKKFKAEILKAIRNADSLYPPGKSASTKSNYNKLGQPSNRLFRFTGSYVRNIKIIKTRSNRIYVGIKKGVRGNNRSRLTIAEYANILEQGSIARNIPARPIWRDTWKKFGGKKRAIQIIKWHINAKFISKHGINLK